MDSEHDDEIRLPDAPPVPGLRVRAFAGFADYGDMADLLNIIARSEGADPFWSPGVLGQTDAGIRDFDPPRDRLIVEVDGVMVGAGRVQCERLGGGERIYFHSFNLLPKWRGHGISRAVLRFQEGRLRQRAGEHSKEGPRYFQAFPVSDRNPAAENLLRDEGYDAVRVSHELVRPNHDPIPDHPLPAGLEVRPIRDEHVRAIWDAKEEAFRDLWGFIPSGEHEFAAYRDDPFWRRDLSRVAWAGDQVAGVVHVYVTDNRPDKPAKRRAYTEMIAVRRPWRRRGVARALIAQTLHALRDAGMTEAALGVDSENPSGAFRLYESMGYRLNYRQTFFRKAMTP